MHPLGWLVSKNKQKTEKHGKGCGELVHRWWERTLDCTAAANNNMLMFATSWMDLEIVVLSEVSQTKKDKYRMIAFFFPLAALDLHC